MADDVDRYEAWYAQKLWTLLPAIYRAQDSDDFDKKGPLRELVDRIGTQAAIVRRSIDRLWEDQSIETCDDWLIPYLGDLLATNLVASLDARGRRVDVGKTIYYRRRKGTVAVLEELAGDITGWSARVVEFFRRMARTRHGLDPAIGTTGAFTGGFADLRNVHRANLTDSAFDEYFHTADVRRGRGATGRYDIPHLGVFVWRLKSLGVLGVTPVQDATCKNQYTFDPTGRDISLFASGDRVYGDQWTSPREHEVPGPISRDLLQAAFTSLYRSDKDPQSLAVYRQVGGPIGHDYDLVTADQILQDLREHDPKIAIDPTRGRIIAPVGVTDGVYRVDYHYGFASEIGAGPYDRRVPHTPGERARTTTPPAPAVRIPSSRATIPAAITALAPVAPSTRLTGTITIDNSLTYIAVADVHAIGDLIVRSANLCRPLVRAAGEWVFEGADDSATLTLDGLFVSGGLDIVLKGEFAHVKLVCCTLDPGSWGTTDWANAADGVPLEPSRLRIEGTVRVLELDRCILGPIVDQTVATAEAETLTVRDSIIQAVRPGELALVLANSTLGLSRCTVLGGAQLHRADVSESIFHDVAKVDDAQHGCVRFSAWSAGSVLPRRYESVKIAPGADLFGSREFGHYDYAQLDATAGSAILEGAEDDSEMGAFAREKCSIKERSILIKFQEYLPLGVEPAIVHVT